MDRLQTVILAGALAFGFACTSDGKQSTASRQRSNAVKASAKDRPDPVAMCDKHYAQGTGPTFAWPAMATKAAAPRANTWRWINLWSTWCQPCVEELPRLVRWRAKLAKAGHDIALVLASADQNADAVAKFRRAHPSTPASARLAKPDDLATWVATMGVKGATLPIHIFVDPTGRVRCVRASAVQEADYAAVAALFGG